MDISSEMIEGARKTSGWTIDFLVHDILAQRTIDIKPFDGILVFHAITPIPGRVNRIHAMKNLKAILQPGGIMIIETFLQENKEDDYWDVQEDMWNAWEQDERLIDFGDIIVFQEGVETFVHIPTRESFTDEIKEAGLKISEIQMSDTLKKSCYWILKP